MWFDLLKWLSEQQDATTVPELQRQVDALIKIGKTDTIVQMIMVLVWAGTGIVLAWYANSLEKRIKKLEAGLLEKRAD